MRISFFKKPQRITKSFLRKAAASVLKGERKQKAVLELVFLGEKEIRRLNFKYRQQNRSTDVLSFALDSETKFPPSFKEKTLGQVIICPQAVAKNAKKSGEPFKKELARVLIHGLLHLCAYEHENGAKKAKRMMAKQEKYLFHIKAK